MSEFTSPATSNDAGGRGGARDRILDAALDAFATNGYHDTGVDHIAKIASISKGAIYLHFPNKRGVFIALVDRLLGYLIDRAERSISEHDDPVEQLDAALQRVFSIFSEHRNLTKVLLIDMAGLGHEFDPKFQEAHERIAAFIRAHLDDVVARGGVEPFDTSLVATAWFGAIDAVVLRWLLTNEPDPLDAALPELRRLLLRSIGLPVPREASIDAGR